jgi:short-chain Z-isoprenyl diphosphate synthase
MNFAHRNPKGDARVRPLHRWLRWHWRVTSSIYRIYEGHLMRQVQAWPVPKHIGLILDGNRRYGRHHQLTDHHEIYMAGAHKLDELLDWCTELQIPSVTLWVFSTQNLKRPSEEVAGILSAVERKLELLVSGKQIHDRCIRVRAVGRLQLLPASTVATLRAAEAATRHHDRMHLTIAAAYGGREEIVDAVQRLLGEQASQGRSLNEVIELVTPDAIGQCLYAPDLPDPDLIIRTSGEIRLSGFLLWQSAFSEFYFTDVYWPAFRRIDFLRAVRAFQQRQRRLGI